MPGTLVSIGLNVPRWVEGAFGLRSNVSMWDGPPLIHSTMQALAFVGVLVLAAVALAASTRLGQVSTLLVCAVVFALGLTSDATLGRHAKDSAVASTLYKIMPNLNLVGVTEALHADAVFVPFRYVWMTAAYCGLFVVAALLIGVALFQTREVG